MNSKVGAVLRFLGLSYRNLGRFDEAKQYFQQGLKLDPHNSSCLFNLGFIAERQGDAAEAETFFQQVLRPIQTIRMRCSSWLIFASRRRDFPKQRSLLQRYVKVSRDPATGYYKLAMVERSMHETAAADRRS